MSEIEPSAPAEVAQALADAQAAGTVVETGGAFTKRSYGGAVAESGATISTRKLDRVLAYEPADLTISVEAGLPWQRLTELLAENGQMLPLDPPFASGATVGGVIATNGSGPRRRRYGTARDLVIGMEFATLEGKLVQSGGMVVKNVTGLDMAKLMIGSLGTLAVITRVNFKIFPKPQHWRTFPFRSADSGALVALRHRILKSQTEPFACDLTPRDGAFTLATEAGGSETLLDRYAKDYGEQASAAGVEMDVAADGEALWEPIRRFQDTAAAAGQCIVRASVTPTRLGELPPLLAASDDWLIRAANGVAYAAVAPAGAASLVAELRSAKVEAVLESAPDEVKKEVDAWAAPGSDFLAMERLKKTFDSGGLLNPGRFYGRL